MLLWCLLQTRRYCRYSPEHCSDVARIYLAVAGSASTIITRRGLSCVRRSPGGRQAGGAKLAAGEHFFVEWGLCLLSPQPGYVTGTLSTELLDLQSSKHSQTKKSFTVAPLQYCPSIHRLTPNNAAHFEVPNTFLQVICHSLYLFWSSLSSNHPQAHTAFRAR